MQKICTNVKLIYYFSYMFISYLEFFIKIFYLLLIQFCFHIFLYCLRIPYIYIKKYAHIHSSFSSSNSHQISHNTSPPACLHHFSFYNSSKKKKKTESSVTHDRVKVLSRSWHRHCEFMYVITIFCPKKSFPVPLYWSALTMFLDVDL